MTYGYFHFTIGRGAEAGARYNGPMRRILVALLLLLGLMFVVAHQGELQRFLAVVRSGDWRFVALAFAFQTVWFAHVAFTFDFLYRALGLREHRLRLLLMALSMNFVNMVAPTAGVSGMAVFASEAREQGQSTAKAMVATTLYIFFEHLGFLAVLFVGLWVLLRRGRLTWVEISASAIMVAIVVGLGSMLYLGAHAGKPLAAFLAWAARRINGLLWPFLRRPWLSEARAHQFGHDLSVGLRALRTNPRFVGLLALMGIGSKVWLMLVLYAVFRAFHVPLSPGTWIVAFTVAYLFLVVSPAPGGVGFVESALTVTLTSFYLPVEDAVVVALVYRGITFWIPLLLGFFALRALPWSRALNGPPRPSGASKQPPRPSAGSPTSGGEDP